MREKKNDIWFYWNGLLDERVRSYVVVTAAALLVIFVAQLMTGSLLAAGIPLLAGLTALGLRWVAMPVFCVALVAYFQALPFGVPLGGTYRIDPHQTHFRIPDLLLCAAVLVYLVAQYRVYSLIHLAVPDERQAKFRRGKTLPDVRDPDLIDEREIPQLLILATAVLVVGQLLWLFLSETVLDFRQIPPIRLREVDRLNTRGAVNPAGSRWLMFVIGAGVLVFLARLGLWYWRIRTLNRDEAQMVLADTGWAEMRREAARQETWRTYGKTRSRKVVPRPKPKPKPRPRSSPWIGAAVGRSCLMILVATVVAILLVCAGVWIFDMRRR